MTQTLALYERWSRLEAEKKAISDDLKELFAEAKGCGYESKPLREAFRIKAKIEDDRDAVATHDAMVSTYLADLDEIPTDRTSRGTRVEVSISAAATPPVPEGKGQVKHGSDEAPAAAVSEPHVIRGQSEQTATSVAKAGCTAPRPASPAIPFDPDPEMPAFLRRTG